jgi:hypothetical protein
MNSKEIYLIISNEVDPTLPFGEAIRATTAAATNFKKAYELALSMGNISLPKLGYKSALSYVTSHYALQLEDKVGTGKITIVLIKKW